MSVVNGHDVTAPCAVGMFWTDGAEIFDDFLRGRVVDIKADLVAASSRAVDASVGPDDKRPNFAAEAAHDFAAFLDAVVRGIVNEQIHVARAAGRRGDVIFAVEAESAAGEIELMVVGEALEFYFA